MTTILLILAAYVGGYAVRNFVIAAWILVRPGASGNVADRALHLQALGRDASFLAAVNAQHQERTVAAATRMVGRWDTSQRLLWLCKSRVGTWGMRAFAKITWPYWTALLAQTMAHEFEQRWENRFRSQ